MVSKIKNVVQGHLYNKAKREYDKSIADQTVSYHDWILQREQEEWEKKERLGKDLSLETVCFKSCGSAFSFDHYKDKDILVFLDDDGEVQTKALAFVADYFASHPEAVIAYADEDELGEDGKRKNPWLKPDWSPDTLISYFYFGGFFAVRLSGVKEIPWLKDTDWKRNLYDFVLRATEINDFAGHMDSVLFHEKKIEPWGFEETFSDLKEAAYKRRGWPLRGEGMVSVIIPSKDNPGVLSNCIHSALECNTYKDFEIIVVDNGSSPQNKARIEKMRDMLAPEYRFTYHYEPMEFNFSKMCNIGVGLAKGDYILLLNDDIEVTQENWLELMMDKAVLPHVGAVGVKLLYPNKNIIQHAGISTIRLGPAHKLQFRDDEHDYYFLRNRLTFDAIGVTGACLLVKKSIYEEAGGFLENMRIAFNDVEFCYHLHEMGYRNVIRNDVCLRHHESLSRGSDDSPEKLKRFHQEHHTLYELHPSLYNHDPYYHRYLVQDVLDAEYVTANRYEYEKKLEKVTPKLLPQIPDEWMNEVVRIGLEFSGDMDEWKTGKVGKGDWFLHGFTYALNVDNCHYRINALLKQVKGDQEGSVWKLPCTRQYRPDVEANLVGFPNVALPGFCITFDRHALPEGDYLIGFLWEDMCSRQKLCKFSAEILEIRD